MADEASSKVVPHLETIRIRSALGPGMAGRRSTLRTYLGLQPGTWWEWAAIWLLQNVRYCPVYILPILTARLFDRIDRADPGKVLGQLPWVLGFTAILCVFTVLANTGANAMLSRLRRSFSAGLRAALIRRINRLEFTFHDRAQFGALQNKFTVDVGRLEGYQSFFAESVLMYGTVVVVMLVVVSCTNPLLLVAIITAIPIHLLLVSIFWNRIQKLNEEYSRAETGFIVSLTEALQGLRLNRSHASEEFTDERVKGAAGMVARKAMELDLMSNFFSSGGWAVSTFLSMAVLGVGTWMAVTAVHEFRILGQVVTLRPITLGELTILISYYGIIIGAMSSIIGGVPAVTAASDAIKSLSELYRDEDAEGIHGKERIDRLTGDVVFEDVHFAYSDATSECLAGIDLRIPAGSSLALVGSSGSGKSTIASLLLGFYQPNAGRVLIDGKDLAQIDLRSLRHHIGVVSQEVVLFQESVLINIAWGDPHPDLARAITAATRANAMDFINRMPGGMGHVLGDRGGGLSGGQRQRLAIARALYRDPRLLILDEATSALDQESERLVQQALDEVKLGRTTLIIAHRLSTVRSAGCICMLSEGRVVEQGTYEELMAREGAFSNLAKGQLV